MQTAELKLHVVREITELSDEHFMKVYNDLIQLLHPIERRPRFGSARGLVQFMATDFDAPLADFNDYMP